MPCNILILGRSIGTGPSTHLSSLFPVGCLILISGYTSLQSLVKDLFGKVISSQVKQLFQNEKRIQDVKCPCFFIHGKIDEIIGYRHTEKLLQVCGSLIKEAVTQTK
jgi:predicted esterase